MTLLTNKFGCPTIPPSASPAPTGTFEPTTPPTPNPPFNPTGLRDNIFGINLGCVDPA